MRVRHNNTVPPPPQFLKTKNSGKSSGKFGQKQWEIREKAIENSGKNNGKFGKKQWEIRAKFQIKILKDLASSARTFSARNSQYTWKYCILDSGGSAMKKFGRGIVSRYNITVIE